LIKLEGVFSGYGKLQILNDISLQAVEGQVSVIVGPNGSGKSTILKTIAGIATMYEGKISVNGRDISHKPPHEIARQGIAYLPQTESVFTQLKVEENIRMAAYTVPPAEYQSRLESGLKVFPQISSYMDSRVQNLSGGERQMVAMIMALMRKPEIIMVDEPTANLSPKLASSVLATVASLAKEQGMTVLLVEQNAKRALEMGDKAFLLVGGRKAFEGGAKELLSHQELARMYLGVKAS
jgi:branched-chain amino acid transport system ATP-binding protein